MNILPDMIKNRLLLKKYRVLLIITMLIGIALILISKTGNNVKDDGAELSQEVSVEDCQNDEMTEEKLEKILSSAFGVGKIEVFISYKSTDEKLVLKDGDGRGGESTVMYEASSGEEPFVYKSLYPQIEGVIIVAEGADRSDVKNTITDAVSAVLEIPLHKVKVLKMK